MKIRNLSNGYRSGMHSLRVTLPLLCIFVTTHLVADEIDNLQLERFELALKLIPDINNGRELYRLCVTCHGPEGWGTQNGSYPQIAGQIPTVTAKQLGDIYSKQRGNPIMEAFTTPRVLKTAQDVADLAAYIASLPMTDNNGKGYYPEVNLGSRIYEKICSSCHGNMGEGHVQDQIPRIQGQHYNYLMRQFSWIRGGHRRNADKKMIRQIQKLGAREQSAVMSYVASLKPAKENLAEAEWRNPDFPNYNRQWLPPAPRQQALKN